MPGERFLAVEVLRPISTSAYPQAPEPILALGSHRSISAYSAYFASKDAAHRISPSWRATGRDTHQAISGHSPHRPSFTVDDAVLEDFFEFLEEGGDSFLPRGVARAS